MTKRFRLYQLFTCFIITLLITFGLMSIWVFYITSQPSTNQISVEGEELSRNYTRYQNKIYILLPGRGYHPINEAHSATFRVFNKNSDSPAVDKSNVYCGRTILNGLNSEKVQLIGNHYITDGAKYYYCGVAERPPETGAGEKIQHLAQSLLYFIGLAPQQMDELYPNHEISNITGPLQNKDQYTSLVSDNKHAYHKGHIIPNADPTKIRLIYHWRYDGLQPTEKGREGYLYFTDGTHVYYGRQQLPMGYQNDLHEIKTGRQNQPAYLYSPTSGELAAEGMMFPKENGPYRLFSHNDAHINHELWLGSNNQLYYYDQEESLIKLMGENPLPANAKEIAPSIWLDNGSLFFLQDKEIVKKRRGGEISSRTYYTYLKQFKSSPTEWQQISKTQYGAIWKNGTEYYYFDLFGNDLHISESIYRITDPNITTQILKNRNALQQIQQLTREEKLQPIESSVLLTAKSTWYEPTSQTIMWLSILSLIILGLIVRWLKPSIKNKEGNINDKRRPFDIHNNQLFFYKVFPKIYRLQEIEKASLELLGTAKLNNKNYLALFTLYLKGKSRPIKRQFVASSQSEENAKEYMKILEERLKEAAVKIGYSD